MVKSTQKEKVTGFYVYLVLSPYATGLGLPLHIHLEMIPSLHLKRQYLYKGHNCCLFTCPLPIELTKYKFDCNKKDK